jgi:hypothetical protein
MSFKDLQDQQKVFLLQTKIKLQVYTIEKMMQGIKNGSVIGAGITYCLEIICSEIKGPFPKCSTYNNKWFILFICAKSKYMTIYFI